jgi:trehalose synthase
MQHVDVEPLDPANFAAVLDEEGFKGVLDLAARAQDIFRDRVLWNVNSTAKGGGVAEMLASLLAYTLGAGVDSRWVVIEGDPEFFRITKRIHNRLHGSDGDDQPLGPAERAAYEQTLARQAEAMVRMVRPGDVVLVHDPQPAGLVDALKERGADVVWRLHVGADEVNHRVREAWDFVRPYVSRADRWVFSRQSFVWDGLEASRTAVIAPSIDIFSPKNQDLSDQSAHAILAAAGLVADRVSGIPEFRREDGSVARVERPADILEERPLTLDRPLVVQVSRWDALKDHGGVMRGFVEHVLPVQDADLVLAGPAAEAVADDPEGAEELDRIKDAWRALPLEARERVHVACLPMDDRQENAAIVNALQRHATVVVQKSLAEGFGLTVAEGMWKSRPVVAGAVGGIQEQVVQGETGWLVDPRDLAAFGSRVADLLGDREAADRMGASARERVLEHFIGVRHLRQWLELFEGIDAGKGAAGS